MSTVDPVEGMNLIQQALARGDSDEEIVQRIVEETGTIEFSAWQMLAAEKGEPFDDVLPPV